MKPRGWAPGCAKACVWQALQAAGSDGLTSKDLLGRLPEFSKKTLEGATWSMKADGWLRQEGNGEPWFVVPSRGTPPVAGLQAGTPTNWTLRDRALALLCEHDSGLNSQSLADELDSTPAEVDAVLETDVESHFLITCKVYRSGQSMLQYRLSAAGPRSYDWNKQSAATFDNRQSAPAAAATAQTPAGEGLQFIGTARIEALADAPDFECALYSTGRMVIKRGGVELALPMEHTRKLLHYLDGLRADDICERALREVA